MSVLDRPGNSLIQLGAFIEAAQTKRLCEANHGIRLADRILKLLSIVQLIFLSGRVIVVVNRDCFLRVFRSGLFSHGQIHDLHILIDEPQLLQLIYGVTDRIGIRYLAAEKYEFFDILRKRKSFILIFQQGDGLHGDLHLNRMMRIRADDFQGIFDHFILIEVILLSIQDTIFLFQIQDAQDALIDALL